MFLSSVAPAFQQEVEEFLVGLGQTCTVLLNHTTFCIRNIHERCRGLGWGVVFWQGLGALSLAILYLRRRGRFALALFNVRMWTME